MLLGPGEQHAWEKWAWDVMQGGAGSVLNGRALFSQESSCAQLQLRAVWEAEGLLLPVLGFKKSMQFGFL